MQQHDNQIFNNFLLFSLFGVALGFFWDALQRHYSCVKNAGQLNNLIYLLCNFISKIIAIKK